MEKMQETPTSWSTATAEINPPKFENLQKPHQADEIGSNCTMVTSTDTFHTISHGHTNIDNKNVNSESSAILNGTRSDSIPTVSTTLSPVDVKTSEKIPEDVLINSNTIKIDSSTIKRKRTPSYSPPPSTHTPFAATITPPSRARRTARSSEIFGSSSPTRKAFLVPSPKSGQLRQVDMTVVNGVPVDPTGMYGFPEFIYADSDMDEDYNEKSSVISSRIRKLMHEEEMNVAHLSNTLTNKKPRGRPKKKDISDNLEGAELDEMDEWQRRQITAYEELTKSSDKKKQRTKVKEKKYSSINSSNTTSSSDSEDIGRSPVRKSSKKGGNGVHISKNVIKSSSVSEDEDAISQMGSINVKEALELERCRSAPLPKGRKSISKNSTDKINVPDRSGRTLIFKYASNGDLEQCSALINAGADLHHQDFAGYTPLHVACLSGHLKVVKLLLKYGADVNCAGGDLDTPLHDAVSNSHRSVVEELLRYGASASAENVFGKTPLTLAEEIDPEVFEILKKWEGMRVEVSERSQNGMTSLHIAAGQGDVNKVKELLEYGSGVDFDDYSGRRPIHEACRGGFVDVVEVLLKYGANVNSGPTEDGVIRSPLIDAVQGLWIDVIKLLLDYGVSVGDGEGVWKTLQEVENDCKDGFRDTVFQIRELLLKTKHDDETGTRKIKKPLYRPQMIQPVMESTTATSVSETGSRYKSVDKNSAPGDAHEFNEDSCSSATTGQLKQNMPPKAKGSNVSRNGDGSVSAGAGSHYTSGIGYHMHNLPSYASITSRNEYFAWGGLLTKEGQEFESSREEKKFKATLKRLQMEQANQRRGYVDDEMDMIDIEGRKQLKKERRSKLEKRQDDDKMSNKSTGANGDAPIKRGRGRPRKNPLPVSSRSPSPELIRHSRSLSPPFTTLPKSKKRPSTEFADDKVSLSKTDHMSSTAKKPRGRPPKRREPVDSHSSAESESPGIKKSSFRLGSWSGQQSISSDDDDLPGSDFMIIRSRSGSRGSAHKTESNLQDNADVRSKIPKIKKNKELSQGVKDIPISTSKVDPIHNNNGFNSKSSKPPLTSSSEKKKHRSRLLMGSGYMAMDANGLPIEEDVMSEQKAPVPVKTEEDISLRFQTPRHSLLEMSFDDQSVDLSKKRKHKSSASLDSKSPNDECIMKASMKKESFKPGVIPLTKPKKPKKKMIFSISGYENAKGESQSETSPTPQNEVDSLPSRRLLYPEPLNGWCLPLYALLLPSICPPPAKALSLNHIPQPCTIGAIAELPKPRYLVDLQVALFLGLESGRELLEHHPQLSRRIATTNEKTFLETSTISEIIYSCMHSRFPSVEYKTCTTMSGEIGLQMTDIEINFLREDEVMTIIAESSNLENIKRSSAELDRPPDLGIETKELDLEPFFKIEMKEEVVKVERSSVEMSPTKNIQQKHLGSESSEEMSHIAAPMAVETVTNEVATELKNNLKQFPFKAAMKMTLKKGR